MRSGQAQAFTGLQTLAVEDRVADHIRQSNLQSVILVPLVVRGSTVGLMTVASDDPDRNFSRDEVRLAETIAGDIAAAVENARLVEQAKIAAATEERSRLARDLHDLGHPDPLFGQPGCRSLAPGSRKQSGRNGRSPDRHPAADPGLPGRNAHPYCWNCAPKLWRRLIWPPCCAN